MLFLRQSTAVNVNIGPFLDSTDGITVESALTITSTDVRLAKNHGGYNAKGDATACTHLEGGWYDCPLNTTDTGTLGPLQLYVNETGALPVWHEYIVLPANVYDSFVSGSDTLDVQVTGMGSGVVTAAAVATGAVDADALAADAVTEIVTGVLTTAMTESYSTDGGTRTLAQALYEIAQLLQESSVSGTTVTVKRVDGTTNAYTLTTNSATTPTSVTRAT